ncbi:transporter substrate-binding domain-containing protein [Vibrio profundum]|uniref:transporter substrate-binding domain-containing protein n=1 Tax=Vibrio profundum TaxID=2910247 RepID=UPI003D0BF2F8
MHGPFTLDTQRLHKRVRPCCLWLIVAVTLTANFSLWANKNNQPTNETIRLTSGEWAPYYGAKLPYQGFDSHIVQAAFATQGINVHYQFYPWVRALHIAKHDSSFRGGVGWGSTKEYRQDFLISQPTSSYEMVFFHRADMPFEWKSYASLQGLKLGLTLGYTYPEELIQYIEDEKIDVEWSSQDELNFKKLARGRIDLYPDDKLVGLSVINRIFKPQAVEQLTFNTKAINTDKLHLVLAKSNPDNSRLLTLFNQGLNEIKKNGTYDKIMGELSLGMYDIASDFTVAIADIYSQDFINEHGETVNLISMLEAIYSNAGIKASFLIYPSERAVKLAHSGVVQALDLRVKSISRSKELLPVEVPIHYMSIKAYGIEDSSSPSFNIRRAKLVGVLGMQYFKTNHQYQGIELVENIDKAVQLVIKGRADAVIVPRYVYAMLKQRYPQLAPLTAELDRVPLYHYVHRSQYKIIPVLENSIVEVTQRNNTPP